MSKRLANLADLTPDTHNANKGTARGRGLLERSLRQYGAGRSILADQHGNIIAGNKTLEAAADIGLPIRVIETDGSELVVVQRRDLDLLTDKAARELAYADNRIAQLDLDWDTEALLADQADGLDLAGVGFADYELAQLLNASAPDFDPAAEWQGMPAFEQDDLTPVKQITINFARAEDVTTFARLLEQNITMSTKSVWYPEQRRGQFSDHRFVTGDDDAA